MVISGYVAMLTSHVNVKYGEMFPNMVHLNSFLLLLNKVKNSVSQFASVLHVETVEI